MHFFFQDQNKLAMEYGQQGSTIIE